MRAIQSAPLALTLPYLAFTPVFVVLTGWIVLGERVELPGVTGIALVVAGAWLLNLGEDDRSSPLAPFRAIWNIRGSRLMLLAAIIYSITSVGGKAAMQWLPAERFGPLYFSMVGFGAALVFGLSQPRRFRIIIDKPLPSLGIAALMALMVLTHFEALSRVEVAYMIAVKRSSLLFGILYGVLLFHERSGLRHFLAGALMVAGITLLAG
jgi:drug/metabolite transporter (DMT)-like permease